MASLPESYIPQTGKNFLTGQDLGRTQALADMDRQTSMQAGSLAASGDLAGARDAFYKGGQFDKGLATQNAIRQMQDDHLQHAAMVQDKLARLASSISTPEEFEMAKARLKSAGLPVGNITFEQLPQLRTEALSVSEQMNLAMQERAMRKKQLTSLKPGETLYDTDKGEVAFTAPSTTDGIPVGSGKLNSGERWRMKGGSLELDGSGRPIAEPIPGTKNEAVPAEVSARIGLADKFLQESPAIKEQIKAGELGTSFGYKQDLGLNLDFNLGIGKPGSIYRHLEDGAEALVRNLTGAGMNKDEATAYARRFLPGRLDGRGTTLDKIDNLERNLVAVKNRVMTGRGIASVDDLQAATAEKPNQDRLAADPGRRQSPSITGIAPPPVQVQTPDEAMKLPSGTLFTTPDGRTKVRP